MKKVLLDFHHKKFDDLSDRSVRQFMRKVGTAVRQAQVRELTDFVFTQDIDYPAKRSIADRLANVSRDAPAYYVERIERGSLIALFVVSPVLLAWLVHDSFVDRVVDDKERRREVLENLRRFVRGGWHRSVARAVADDLEKRELGSHIVAERVKVKKRGADVVVDVKLVTERDDDDPPPKPRDTLQTIEIAIDRKLDDLDGGGR